MLFNDKDNEKLTIAHNFLEEISITLKLLKKQWPHNYYYYYYWHINSIIITCKINPWSTFFLLLFCNKSVMALLHVIFDDYYRYRIKLHFLTVQSWKIIYFELGMSYGFIKDYCIIGAQT